MKNMIKVLSFITLCLTLTSFVLSLNVYAQAPQHIRIALMRNFSNQQQISIGDNQVIIGIWNNAFVQTNTVSSENGFTATSVNGRVQIVSSTGQIIQSSAADGSMVIQGSNNMTRIGEYLFRGVIELRPSGNQVSAINIVSLEYYLRSVVPSEMGTGFHIQAYRAQAVASRTFAVHQITGGTHAGNPHFDLCDSTCCQVYLGVARENDITTQAVLDTTGIMIYFQGAPISAHFFASSGGATDNSENVWGAVRPYLRGVSEIATENIQPWTRHFTWNELSNIANSGGFNIGQVYALEITNMSANGRVQELTFRGFNGTRSVQREQIRTIFSTAGQASLMSRMFTISGGGGGTQGAAEHVVVTSGVQTQTRSVNDLIAINGAGGSANLITGFIYDGTTLRQLDSGSMMITGGQGVTIQGRGHGHGVGMSQMGAEAMARQGMTFQQILLHYFTGVEVR